MSALLSAAHELEVAARFADRQSELEVLVDELAAGLDVLADVLAVLTTSDPRRLAPAAASLSNAVSALHRAGVAS